MGTILIIFFIIATSGCTYKDNTPSREKQYSGNGFSFNYPPEYDVKEVKNKSGVFVVGQSGWDSNYTFQISKESLDDYAKAQEKTMEDLKNPKLYEGFMVEEIENIKISNVSGFEIIYARYDPPYVKYEKMIFEKNHNRYTLLFEYKGVGVTDTRATLTISNSFKVLN
jgi:hypothetical protein